MRGLALALLCGCGAKAVAPDAGPTLRYPAVPYGGGAVLADATLVSVTFAGDARAAAHHAFVAALPGWLLERTGEYGVRAVTAGAPLVLSVAPPATDAELRALLPSVPALYLVFLPDGAELVDRYGNRTCASNPGTGYHESVDSTSVPYVAVPACRARFAAVLDVAGSMHLDAARLAVDALTNPSPRNAPAYALSDAASGWRALGAEVGDFCWGRLVVRDGVTLQRVWSNAAVARGKEPCAPSMGAAFGLAVDPAGRQRLRIAETMTLTVTGWSASTRDDFTVEVTPWSGDFAIEASLSRSSLNAEQTATLSLRVPYAVPVGSEGAVLLRAIGADDAPLWPVAFVTR